MSERRFERTGRKKETQAKEPVRGEVEIRSLSSELWIELEVSGGEGESELDWEWKEAGRK